MADDLQRLIVSLEARINQYERNMARAERNSDRRLGNIERRFQRANKNISASLSRFVGPAAAGLVSAATLRSLTQLADASTRVQNALKVTGAEGEKLRQVYDGLFASAQRNAAPLESLVELYSRASLVQGELKVSTEELLKFTDNVALALRAQGGSAESARGALLQLSQALGSGIVRAEEFNSLLEGAPAITQAVAAGLEEAGGSVAKLRSLVVDGKVSSQAFFRAFEAGAQILEDRVASAELTVSQGFVRLQNVLIDTVGKLDDLTGASNKAGPRSGGWLRLWKGSATSSRVRQMARWVTSLPALPRLIGSQSHFLKSWPRSPSMMRPSVPSAISLPLRSFPKPTNCCKSGST